MIRSVEKLLLAGLIVAMPVVCDAQDARTSRAGHAVTPSSIEASAVPAEQGFVPSWKIGEKWVLEASYRDQRLQGDVWLPPVQWVFQVKSMKSVQRTNCYVVHVYPKAKNLKLQAILYLSTRDLRPMRLIEIFPTANGVKNREVPIDPFHAEPLLGDDTLIPYDLPVFPLVRPSQQRADGFAAYAAPEPKVYDKINKVAGFSFKRQVSQTDKKPDRQHADAFAAYRLGGETFQVELTDARSGTVQTQLWQEGSPWAISNDSENRRVRLIPPEAPSTPALLKNNDEPKEGEE